MLSWYKMTFSAIYISIVQASCYRRLIVFSLDGDQMIFNTRLLRY
jgi:hypothetical protein